MNENLHLAALRAQSLPFRIQEFIDYKILDIGNQTITKAIREEAASKGMDDRYINSIQSEFSQGKFTVWVDYKGPDGEPLDLYFEEGTKDHFIKPKTKKALSWIVGGFVKGFSKGHMVSGIKARHIFRDGFEKGYPEFLKLLQSEVEKNEKETKLFG